MIKTVSFIFTVIRDFLGYLGIGKGNCLYYPSCSDAVRSGFLEEGVVKTITSIVPRRIFICNPIYKKFGKKWQ